MSEFDSVFENSVPRPILLFSPAVHNSSNRIIPKSEGDSFKFHNLMCEGNRGSVLVFYIIGVRCWFFILL